MPYSRPPLCPGWTQIAGVRSVVASMRCWSCPEHERPSMDGRPSRADPVLADEVWVLLQEDVIIRREDFLEQHFAPRPEDDGDDGPLRGAAGSPLAGRTVGAYRLVTPIGPLTTLATAILPAGVAELRPDCQISSRWPDKAAPAGTERPTARLADRGFRASPATR